MSPPAPLGAPTPRPPGPGIGQQFKDIKQKGWDSRSRTTRWLAVASLVGVVAIVLSVIWPTPLTAIGTLLAAIAAVVFGIGGHEVRTLFFRPILDVQLNLEAPDAILIQTEVRTPRSAVAYLPTFYYRLRIANRGNASAREVEVRLLRLRNQDPLTQSFTLDKNFLPLNLTWSHVGGVVLQSIHANLFYNCDLLHRVEDNALARSAYPDPSQFMFNTQVTPTPVAQGVWPTLKPVGVYELDLVAYAANAEPVNDTLTIDYRGWFPTEADMFTRGLIITPKPK